MNLILLITIYVVGVSARQILNVDHIVRRNAGQLPSYPSPSAPAESSVDLHNKEFCVDVSTYQPVVWVERSVRLSLLNNVKTSQRISVQRLLKLSVR